MNHYPNHPKTTCMAPFKKLRSKLELSLPSITKEDNVKCPRGIMVAVTDNNNEQALE